MPIATKAHWIAFVLMGFIFMSKKIGIYKITSPTGRIYIGQSRDIIKRKSAYKRHKCIEQTKLYSSIKKHGWDKHMFEVIHYCDIDDLNKLEKYYIQLHNSFNTIHGLNLQSGGYAYTHSKESLKKISEASKNRKVSEETKRKISQSLIGNKRSLGYKHSEETKIKCSIASTGRFHSKETKIKMSEVQKGIIRNVGSKRTDETKLKMRLAQLGKKVSDETKKKISEFQKGKKFSQERIDKMKAGWQKRRERLNKLNNNNYEQ